MNDDRYSPGRCTICFQNTDVRHINLYVIGSEGLLCCHSCEMKIVQFCRQTMNENTTNRKIAALNKKRTKQDKG